MKKINILRIKILIHLLSILLLLFGFTILHAVMNWKESMMYFFNIPIFRIYIADIGFLCIGLSFSTEFLMTWKPIKIIN